MAQKFQLGDIVTRLNGKKPAEITYCYSGYQSYDGYYSCKYINSGTGVSHDPIRCPILTSVQTNT